jgi:hypothetical protein
VVPSVLSSYIMSAASVTIHLPLDLLSAVDEQQADRDAFVEQAVRHELARRAREGLRASLEQPHPESRDLAEVGLAAWARSLPEDDAAAMCDLSAGTPVRWSEESGWVEGTA